jgi:hypothetical protein
VRSPGGARVHYGTATTGVICHHVLLLRFGCVETEAAIVQGPSLSRPATDAIQEITSAASVAMQTSDPWSSAGSQHVESSVRRTGLALVIALALGLVDCGGSDSPVMPLMPSPLLPPAVVPPPAHSPSFPPGTLRDVSLSGVVYELAATGRAPIPGAIVYCELCGQETHTFATADGSGFYRFSGDITKGGGVWVVPGVPILLAVGYNEAYKDPPGLPAVRFGPGWREVLIDGDTRFDIELVRR